MRASIRKQLSVCALLVIGIACYLLWSRENTNLSAERAKSRPVTKDVHTIQEGESIPPISDELAASSKEDRTAKANDLLKRWDRAKTELKGDARLAEQQSIAEEAADSLGLTDELATFVVFLRNQGVMGVQDRLIEKRLKAWFSPPSPKAWSWMVALKDVRVRTALAAYAGSSFTGDNFKDRLSSLPDIHSQSRFLSSYCATIAKDRPSEAVEMFFEMRPAGVDMSGLARVTESLGPTADFMKISESIGDDSKSTAKEARKGLLKSWAKYEPEAAAQFIISNPKIIASTQLGPVIDTWLSTAPEEAVLWISNLVPGKYMDVALQSHSNQLLSSQPSKAWQVATQIQDVQTKTGTLQKIYDRWVVTDPHAADAAFERVVGKPPGR